MKIGAAFWLIVILVSSCAPMSKDVYLNNYDKFVENVRENHEKFTESDWINADKKFDEYSNKLFVKFEPEFTLEEKVLVTKYRLQYDIYRYKDDAIDIILDALSTYTELKNEISREIKNQTKQEISEYIDNDLEEDIHYLFEYSGKIKDILKLKVKDYIDNDMANDIDFLNEQLNLIKEKTGIIIKSFDQEN